MEVRQRMKLTGTNSSIGLIVLIDYAHRTKFDVPKTFVLAAYANLRFAACGRPAKRLATAAGLYGCLKYSSGLERFNDVFKD